MPTVTVTAQYPADATARARSGIRRSPPLLHRGDYRVRRLTVKPTPAPPARSTDATRSSVCGAS